MPRKRSQTVLNNDLPSIQKMELSDEQMTSYLSDLFAGATRMVIRVKDSAQSDYRLMNRLAELHVAILNKHIWSAELAYTYEGRQWVDQLEIQPQTTRVNRQQQRAILIA